MTQKTNQPQFVGEQKPVFLPELARAFNEVLPTRLFQDRAKPIPRCFDVRALY
jgi:hypothetical protein